MLYSIFHLDRSGIVLFIKKT